MNASVSLYFYYEGQPYPDFYVELIDPSQTDADNPVDIGWTDANGHVLFRGAQLDWLVKYTTPAGTECLLPIDTTMGIVELAGWR